MLTFRNRWIALVGICLVSASIVRADLLSHDGTVVTSVLRLLAHPEKYAGKRVQVRGYYTSGFEVSGLFMGKELAGLDSQNGIWIDLPEPLPRTKTFERVSRGYVTVIGTFGYSPSGVGHMGGWPGQLTNITLFVRATKF